MVVGALAVAVAGCGGGADGGDDSAPRSTAATTDDTSPSSTSVPTATAEPVCGDLRTVADLNERSKRLVAEGVAWETMQRFLVTESPAAVEAYERAARNAPPHLASDITILREYTEQAIDAARRASSYSEFGANATALPTANSAGAAGERLGTFSRTACGFELN